MVEVRATFENKPLDKAETKSQLTAYVGTLSDAKVDETARELAQAIVEAQQEIAKIKARQKADAAKPQIERDLDSVRTAYDKRYTEYSIAFDSNRSFAWIFNKDPYQAFNWDLMLELKSDLTTEAKIKLYNDAIEKIDDINRVLNSISTIEVSGFTHYKENLEEFARLGELRGDLLEQHEALTSQMDSYNKRAERYVDDASLNCSASSVDFDCGNRCETQERDPIFGTYRKGVDRNCLSRCNAAEGTAQRELADDINDCRSTKRRARQKLDDIEQDANVLTSKIKRLGNEYDDLSTKMGRLKESIQAANNLYERLDGYPSSVLKPLF